MPARIIDMTGNTYGAWTVLRRAEPPDGYTSYNKVWWECLCACGEIAVRQGTSLRNGTSTRCRDCADRAKRGTGEQIAWKGRSMNLREWADLLGLPEGTLMTRLRHDWPLDRAFRLNVDPAILAGLEASARAASAKEQT